MEELDICWWSVENVAIRIVVVVVVVVVSAAIVVD